MRLRTPLMLAATCAAGAIIAIPLAQAGSDQAPAAAMPAPAGFGLDADCATAGVTTHAGTEVGAAPRVLSFAGEKLLVTPEDRTARPAEMVGATAASPDARTVVTVIDRRGPDQLLLSTDAGRSWTELAAGPDLIYPAVSPSGDRLAWTAAGQLTTRTTGSAGKPQQIKLPAAASKLAEYVRFADDRTLIMTVEAEVAGVPADLAGLSDVWTYDLVRGTWTRLTSGEADADRWTLASTPVTAPDGSVLYVRSTGLGSGTIDDLRTELVRLSGPVGERMTETVVTELPDRWGLVSVDADGTTLWNAPDQRSQWQLVRWAPDGIRTPLGCGRASWAPSLNHDPDYVR